MGIIFLFQKKNPPVYFPDFKTFQTLIPIHQQIPYYSLKNFRVLPPEWKPSFTPNEFSQFTVPLVSIPIVISREVIHTVFIYALE